MQIIKYQTEAEMQQIIAEKIGKGLILVEVQNIIEGNFLGFKEPSEIPESPPPSPSLQELAQAVTDLTEILNNKGLIP